jgi:hypothetical protein
MRPAPWNPPVELSPVEQGIVKRIRRAKLFVILREWRHELFDEAFRRISDGCTRRVGVGSRRCRRPSWRWRRCCRRTSGARTTK